MIDNREAIIARLLEIGPQVGDFRTMGRNIIDLPDTSGLPAFIVYDGDESVDEGSRGRGRPSHGPMLVTLECAVLMCIKGSPERIGTTANDMRKTLVNSVLLDATLISLCNDGQMFYSGCDTTVMAEKGTPVMAMAVAFEFNFLMMPQS